MSPERAPASRLALLFAASAAGTIVCASMSAMGDADARRLDDVDGMDADARTDVAGAAASFLGMWVMMVAMMLPSLVPMLGRYRRAVGGTGEARLGRLTALAGVGYFVVWTVLGMVAFPLGVALAEAEMRQPELARAVPLAVGVVVLIAGALQFTAWKASSPGRLPGLTRARHCALADAGTAWLPRLAP